MAKQKFDTTLMFKNSKGKCTWLGHECYIRNDLLEDDLHGEDNGLMKDEQFGMIVDIKNDGMITVLLTTGALITVSSVLV